MDSAENEAEGLEVDGSKKSNNPKRLHSKIRFQREESYIKNNKEPYQLDEANSLIKLSLEPANRVLDLARKVGCNNLLRMMGHQKPNDEAETAGANEALQSCKNISKAVSDFVNRGEFQRTPYPYFRENEHRSAGRPPKDYDDPKVQASKETERRHRADSTKRRITRVHEMRNKIKQLEASFRITFNKVDQILTRIDEVFIPLNDAVRKFDKMEQALIVVLTEAFTIVRTAVQRLNNWFGTPLNTDDATEPVALSTGYGNTPYSVPSGSRQASTSSRTERTKTNKAKDVLRTPVPTMNSFQQRVVDQHQATFPLGYPSGLGSVSNTVSSSTHQPLNVPHQPMVAPNMTATGGPQVLPSGNTARLPQNIYGNSSPSSTMNQPGDPLANHLPPPHALPVAGYRVNSGGPVNYAPSFNMDQPQSYPYEQMAPIPHVSHEVSHPLNSGYQAPISDSYAYYSPLSSMPQTRGLASYQMPPMSGPESPLPVASPGDLFRTGHPSGGSYGSSVPHQQYSIPHQQSVSPSTGGTGGLVNPSPSVSTMFHYRNSEAGTRNCASTSNLGHPQGLPQRQMPILGTDVHGTQMLAMPPRYLDTMNQHHFASHSSTWDHSFPQSAMASIPTPRQQHHDNGADNAQLNNANTVNQNAVGAEQYLGGQPSTSKFWEADYFADIFGNQPQTSEQTGISQVPKPNLPN